MVNFRAGNVSEKANTGLNPIEFWRKHGTRTLHGSFREGKN